MADMPSKSSPLSTAIVAQSAELDMSILELTGSSIIGLDTESNSLHRYPEQLCLIQIATQYKTYLIDTISLKSIIALKKVLQDESIVKIIHGADYDVRSLDRHGGLRIRNIFDTYIAARFAGAPKVGLADLLQDLLGVMILKSKHLQHSDWGQRPLSDEAIEYASTDVRYLLPLKELLEKKLQQLGRTAWVLEECSRLEDIRYTSPNLETAFLSIKGAQTLDGRGLAILKGVFMFRDEEARRQHRPPFFIIPDNTLVNIANNPPSSMTDVPGLSQNRSHQFWNKLQQAVRDGQNASPIENTVVTFEPFKPEQMQLLKRLKNWRESMAATLSLEPPLLWPTTSLERLAKAPHTFQEELTSTIIRRWQRDQFASSLETLLNNP
jgi:ribonuclease D